VSAHGEDEELTIHCGVDTCTVWGRRRVRLSRCEAVHADVRSAIVFRIGTFGADAVEPETPALEAFVAETTEAGCGGHAAGRWAPWLAGQVVDCGRPEERE
jgi:hypothetical protein